MFKNAVALLDSDDKLLNKAVSSGLKDLGNISPAKDAVTNVSSMAEQIKGAGIILIQESLLEENPDLIEWINSLEPFADAWVIVSDSIELSEDCSPNLDTRIDCSISRQNIISDSGEVLHSRIQRRLKQKDLLEELGIISKSPRIGMIAETIEKVGPTDLSVLIVGPSGSGKEIIARALHSRSGRANKPFIALNCGAIPEGLIESELFGHEKGAFTGSVARRDGFFAKADGGTLFLDEIGEMKPDMQVKLLRVLEEGVVHPLGSSQPRTVNVRAIAATNLDLNEAMRSGRFRDDLFFRLAGVKIQVPSISERPEDIVPLLAFFSKDTSITGYTSEALKMLGEYHWPGNVRQLKNFVVRMTVEVGSGEVGAPAVRRYLEEQWSQNTALPVVTADASEQIGQELIYRALLQLGAEVKSLRELIHSNQTIPGAQFGKTATSNSAEVTPESFAQSGSIEEMEARMMAQTLKETDGNRRLTARRLGIGERTLYRKLKKFGLN